MTGAPAVANPPPVCPYLGMRDDPATHLAFVSSAQVCHAGRRPVAIDAVTQANTCLTDGHVACPRYRPVGAPGMPPARGTAVGAAPSWGAAVLEAGSSGVPGRRASGPSGAVRLVLLAVVIGAIGLVGVAMGFRLASVSRGGGNGSPGAAASAPVSGQGSFAPTTPAEPTTGATTSPTPTPPAPTPAPTATPAPTVTPSPTATPTPTAAPSPAARTYKVRAGDTLTTIALRFGVTVEAIVTANQLADPNAIIVGQRLVIPLP